MNFVYLITNLVNGKKYVGKTSWTIHRRWLRHKMLARNNCTSSRIHSAIRKYGENSFSIKQLAKTEDEDVVCYLEMF